jgi:hypothetical protein
VLPTFVSQSYQTGKNVPGDFLLRRTEAPNDLFRLVGNGARQLTARRPMCVFLRAKSSMYSVLR